MDGEHGGVRFDRDPAHDRACRSSLESSRAWAIWAAGGGSGFIRTGKLTIQIAGGVRESFRLLLTGAFPREDGARRISLLGQPAGPRDGDDSRSPRMTETPRPLDLTLDQNRVGLRLLKTGFTRASPGPISVVIPFAA